MNFVVVGFRDSLLAQNQLNKFWISIFDVLNKFEGSVSEINRDVSSAKDNIFPIVDLSMSFT